MKKATGDVINAGSLMMLLFLAATEGEIIFAHPLFKAAERDTWLSIILGALATYPLLFVMLKLAQRFPGRTFFEYTPLVWGKFPAYGIILIFTGVWLVWLVKILWQVGDINSTYFLPNTPLLIVYFLFILGAVYLAKYGLVPISRFFDLMLIFFFVPYIISIFLSLTNIRLVYFFPILGNGILPVLKGSLIYIGMIQGIEVVLFALPLTKNPKKAFSSAFLGLTILHTSNLLNIIGIGGTVGAHSSSQSFYSSMDMLNSLKVPGLPVERFEPFLTMPWFIGVFTSTVLAIYLITYGVSRIIPLKKMGLFCLGIGILALALTYLISDILWSQDIRNVLQTLYVAVIYPLPLITLLLSILRKKGEGSTE